MNSTHSLLAALFLAASVALGGWFVGQGFLGGRTANAREATTQFAADSGSTLGGIRQASQGLFQILPRDHAPGVSQEGLLFKTVRVVSTIQYYLEN